MMFLKSDTVIGRSLDLYGEWCESEMAVLGKILQPGHWVLDVGANIGTHTVFFAKAVGKRGRVYAAEPQRLVRNVLCANLALNDLGVVHVLSVALGAERRQVSTEGFAIDEKRNFGRFSLVGAASGREKLSVRPADELRLRRCDLIKIDVEGLELDVLKGATALIDGKRPAIWLENNIDDQSAGLTEWLESHGYMLFWHFDSRFNADNFRGVRKNIFLNVQKPSINMLALPSDRTDSYLEAQALVMPMIKGESIADAWARWQGERG